MFRATLKSLLARKVRLVELLQTARPGWPSEPACAALSPRDRRRPACSRWVAE